MVAVIVMIKRSTQDAICVETTPLNYTFSYRDMEIEIIFYWPKIE